MREFVTRKRMTTFLRTLKDEGGSCGNGRLRDRLGWSEDLYWNVRERLVDEERIGVGRGRGGSVHMI